jgi:4-amino-4-deoxy-L-arabinose transferase-like glycosyltransferase
MEQTDTQPAVQSCFPQRGWERWDYVLLGVVTILGCLLFWSGLSVRSLWGPEGRWAVIVKEMVTSGNYFLPTVNGIVDADKPLLSYWAILPFVWIGGFSEAMLRVPSTLGGIGTVIVVFVMGLRLFDRRTAFIASLLLLSSTMFVLWSRTASAESINTFAIWAILWAFLSYAAKGRFRDLLALYCIAVVGCFFKGPVAAVAGFVVIFLYSLATSVLRLRESPPGRTWRAAFLPEFRWIASGKGIAALLGALCLFALFLLAPVLFTGSWDSVSLMWKENVTRFLRPFDHTDPPTVYFKYVLLICAPWSFLMIASLWESRSWQAAARRRFLITTALGIFCFFELSGSRRGYYILPLLPCLALIAAKVIADWTQPRSDQLDRLDRTPIGSINSIGVRVAAATTAGVMALASGALLYLCFKMGLSWYVFAAAGAAMVAALVSLRYFVVRKTTVAVALLFTLMLICQVWIFNHGMELAEQKRTLRSFARQAARQIEGVEHEKITLYRQGTASLIYYLNAGFNIANCDSVEELERFRQKHPDGVLIVDLDDADAPQEVEYLNRMETLVAQNTTPKERGERFVVLRFKASEAR